MYTNGLGFLLALFLHCMKQKNGLLTSKSFSIMSVLWRLYTEVQFLFCHFISI